MGAGRGAGSLGCLSGPLPHHYPNQFVASPPLPSKPVRPLCAQQPCSTGRWVSKAAILVATGFLGLGTAQVLADPPRGCWLKEWGRSQKGTVVNTGMVPSSTGHPLRGRAQAKSELSCPGQQEPAPSIHSYSEESDTGVSFHPSLLALEVVLGRCLRGPEGAEGCQPMAWLSPCLPSHQEPVAVSGPSRGHRLQVTAQSREKQR